MSLSKADPERAVADATLLALPLLRRSSIFIASKLAKRIGAPSGVPSVTN